MPKDKDKDKDVDKDTDKASDKKDDQSITLSSKNEWAQLLDEETRKDPAIVRFDSLEDLARAVINVKTKDTKLDDDSSTDDYIKASEETFGNAEADYSKNFEHKDLAHKFRLPKKLIEPFMEELKVSSEKSDEKSKEEQLKKFKKRIEEKVDKDVFDIRFDAGLKALGFTRDEFKEKFGEIGSHNPDLVIPITELGRKQYSDAQTKVDEGTSGLPEDLEVLSTKIRDLTRRRQDLKLAKGDYYSIEKDIQKLKLQHAKVQHKQRRKAEVSFI